MTRTRSRRGIARLGKATLGAGVAVLVWAGPASAHPLGNFTVNTAAAIVLRPAEVLVDYTVDMAEIPTLQERQRIDADRDGSVSDGESAAYRRMTCRALGGGLRLTVDGTRVGTTSSSSTLTWIDGEAGLTTLRLTCGYRAAIAPAGRHEMGFEDRNHAGRLGWHEVTAVGDGTTLTRSDVPSESPSDGLRSYPEGVSALDVRTATVTIRPGGPTLVGESETSGTAANGGLLAGLAARPDPSPIAVAIMVLAAVAVGAVHALGPGHGKSLIGASLIGSGGTLRQAVGIGAAVSVMHTASVLALGLVVLTAERLADPERVYPWLGLASGLVALGLGAVLLVTRIHAVVERRRHGHHHHDHADRPLSRRGLLALAFSGGILPSPSALVVLLGSISIGRPALGLLLIAAFSVGLASSLVAVGALAIRARQVAVRRFPVRLMRLAPVLSAASIAAIGAVLTVRGVLAV